MVSRALGPGRQPRQYYPTEMVLYRGWRTNARKAGVQFKPVPGGSAAVGLWRQRTESSEKEARTRVAAEFVFGAVKGEVRKGGKASSRIAAVFAFVAVKGEVRERGKSEETG